MHKHIITHIYVYTHIYNIQKMNRTNCLIYLGKSESYF